MPRGQHATATVMTKPLHTRNFAELSPECFQLMVESIRDYAIFALDAEGRVANWNAAAERVKGWKEEEVIGKNFAIFHTPEDRAEGKPARELQLAREHGRYEEIGERVRSDGSRYPARVSLAPMRAGGGEVVGYVKVIQNLTEQESREAELERLKDSLERRVAERTRELESVVAQLESFSYSISHDLRGPLRAMEGFSTLLLENHSGQLDASGRHYLERISAAARRMDRLVQDVLALSRVQRARLQVHAVDLNRLIPELVDQYHHLHDGAARIEIERPLLPVQAHEPSLVQCLSNLLANAVKFAREGVQPVITIATAKVGESFVRIWVRDNGVGIRPEDRERIFRMFEQVLTPRSAGGSGIGLAIVKAAVERMGGSVGVESEPGVGSSFYLQLAAAPTPGHD